VRSIVKWHGNYNKGITRSSKWQQNRLSQPTPPGTSSEVKSEEKQPPSTGHQQHRRNLQTRGIIQRGVQEQDADGTASLTYTNPHNLIVPATPPQRTVTVVCQSSFGQQERRTFKCLRWPCANNSFYQLRMHDCAQWVNMSWCGVGVSGHQCSNSSSTVYTKECDYSKTPEKKHT
jgi:hypothetical protein